jgi:MFS family permease
MLESSCNYLSLLVQADFLGRRWAMGIGCFITVVATFIQTFAPYHKIGVFIFGRVLIGLGQGIALSQFP